MKKSNWMATGFGRFVSPDLIEDELLDAEVVVLLEGQNAFGHQLFCYLQITCQNLKEIFRKIRDGENFSPADFGSVIVAGQGEPTAEIISEMHTEHNIIDVPRIKSTTKIEMAEPEFSDEESQE